ncbi:MAG: CvpA family protein [Lachnospiraceae bacterium]|nr:CvpA family protein [Lachnospiraceae bacterium]
MKINLVFIIVLAIIGINMFIGWRRGFIKMIFRLIFVGAAIMLTIWLMPYGTKLLQKTPIYSTISDKIESNIDEKVPSAIDSKVSEQIEAINDLNLPDFLKNKLIENNNATTYEELGVNKFSSYVAGYLTNLIMNAISAIFIFVLSCIILLMIEHVLNAVAHLPVLRGFNKGAGLLLGIVVGLFFVWVLGLVVTAIAGTSIGAQISAQINENSMLTWLYEHNYLVKLATGIVGIFK